MKNDLDMIKKLIHNAKNYKLLMGTPLQSYKASPAIYE